MTNQITHRAQVCIGANNEGCGARLAGSQEEAEAEGWTYTAVPSGHWAFKATVYGLCEICAPSVGGREEGNEP